MSRFLKSLGTLARHILVRPIYQSILLFAACVLVLNLLPSPTTPLRYAVQMHGFAICCISLIWFLVTVVHDTVKKRRRMQSNRRSYAVP